MNKILILADDLTGANDTGAAIVRFGWNTVSIVDAGERPLNLEDYSCISVNLDSRSLKPEAAYQKVADTARDLRKLGIGLYSKRIDSTLRGNLGAESDALLDVLTADEKKDWAALIVPAFPQAGRTYENDTLYVNGIPLTQTSAAKDPKRPIDTSSALELFRRQSERKTELIRLDVVRNGEERTAEAIRQCLGDGIRNILFEAVTQEDIEMIAKAATRCPYDFIAVDPGTFTAALAAAKFGSGSDQNKRKERTYAGDKVLAVIGSINQVARIQTARLIQRPDAGYAVLDIEKILEDEYSCEECIGQAIEKLRAIRDEKAISVLLLSSSIGKEPMSLTHFMKRDGVSIETICDRMNQGIAKTAARLLEDGGYGGLFTTGGDITVAVCMALNTAGIDIRDEILPLAVGGELPIPDGRYISVATKGGMIGGEEATCQCVDYLQEKIKERM